MTPIFDQGKNVVAWFDGANVFDPKLNWIAFHSDGNLFSAASLAWLGPLDSGGVQDRGGKAVAWLEGSSPSSGLRPLTPIKPLRPLQPLKPLRPLRPLTPLTPLTPLGGWSARSWHQWLNGG